MLWLQLQWSHVNACIIVRLRQHHSGTAFARADTRLAPPIYFRTYNHVNVKGTAIGRGVADLERYLQAR